MTRPHVVTYAEKRSIKDRHPSESKPFFPEGVFSHALLPFHLMFIQRHIRCKDASIVPDCRVLPKRAHIRLADPTPLQNRPRSYYEVVLTTLMCATQIHSGITRPNVFVGELATPTMPTGKIGIIFSLTNLVIEPPPQDRDVLR